MRSLYGTKGSVLDSGHVECQGQTPIDTLSIMAENMNSWIKKSEIRERKFRGDVVE